MVTSAQGRVLWHGTTRRRAEAILKNGPDPNFREPGGLDKAGEFATAPAEGPFPVATPPAYALGKANLFPDEGGSVILDVEVPPEIVAVAVNVGDMRLRPGDGLDGRHQAWPALPKRILP